MTARLPLRPRLAHWWMFHGREAIKTAGYVIGFVAIFVLAGTLDYIDAQEAEIRALEMSGRAHSGALAALLNGRAITNRERTWAAKCENVVTVERRP